MRNIRLIVVMVQLIVFYSNGSSQSDSATSHSSKAIMFSFSGLNLGGCLSGKLWLKDDVAMRVDMTIYYKSSIDDRPLLDSSSSSSSNYDTRFDLSVNVEKHFHGVLSVSPYIGMGIGLSWEEYRDEDRFFKETTGRINITRTYEGIVFGGFEYWLSPTFSLSGEQSISFEYMNSNPYKDFTIYNTTSKLRLGIYF